MLSPGADSSLAYDLQRKPLVYARFGVRELWVVDATRRRTHVHRDPAPDGYGAITVVEAAAPTVPAAAPAFGLALDDLETI